MLYNGIELPQRWPPRRTAADIRKYEPMPVPYLRHPPEVIPIDVGRQLFVDDFLVEKTTLKRRFHRAEPYSGNPVLRPEKGWEKDSRGLPQSAMAFSDGCFYDPQDKLFKIWYRPALFVGTCLATSLDGIHWEKHELDVQPGSNLVLLGGLRDSSTVWLDHDAVNSAERFKLFQWQRTARLGSVHTSPDGIHWSGPAWCGQTGDRSTFFYNPFRKVWVFSIRAHPNRDEQWRPEVRPVNELNRARKYWETKDFVAGAQWSARGNPGGDWPEDSPQYWVGADKLDAEGLGPNELKPELYNLDATPYESLMLGLFSIWRRPQLEGSEKVLPGRPRQATDQPKLNEVQLGFSRDGFHWDRPFREAVIPFSNEPGTWNYGNVQSVGGGCLIVGDQIYMYASGRNATEDTTGLMFFRRDGFASMEAGEHEGTLTTRPVEFTGKYLFVNLAAPQGSLSVEILDREGTVIAPFSRDNCLLANGDKTLLKINWKSEKDLQGLAGMPVRFRFHLKNGALYAFWVSPESSGASHGYVAAQRVFTKGSGRR